MDREELKAIVAQMLRELAPAQTPPSPPPVKGAETETPPDDGVLPDADCEAMHARIRLLFPDGVPLVMAVREADHRLYLDLRAVARREGKTLGDYLREKGLMAGRANLPEPPESSADKG